MELLKLMQIIIMNMMQNIILNTYIVFIIMVNNLKISHYIIIECQI